MTRRFRLFDGLRAIAALSVVFLHVSVYSNVLNGWAGAMLRQLAAGVTVFFLISGFLLYRPFVAARLSGGAAPATPSFLRRRALRILPAYWLALTVLALYPRLPGFSLRSAWLYYGFGQDFTRHSLFNGLGTAWSLGTEVTFYALLPLYAFALSRLRPSQSRRRLVTSELTALALLSAASVGFRAAVNAGHPNLGYTLGGTFDWFALGMALAVVSVAVEGIEPPAAVRRPIALIVRRPDLSWAMAGLLWIVAAAWFMHSRDYDAYSAGPLHFLWGGIALFALLPVVFDGAPGLCRRLLGSRILAWLGLISYGIYLWHLPLVQPLGRAAAAVGAPTKGAAGFVVVGAAVAAVAIACAAASYFLVERRFLRLKSRRRLPVVDAAPAPSAA